MEQIKINALLNYLGETLESANVDVFGEDNNKTIFVDNAEYMILTEDEAKEEFYDYQKMLIDDLGLDAFVDWAKDEILKYHTTQDCKQLFDEIIEEYAYNFIEDLKYMNELEQTMQMYDCETVEELVEWYMQDDTMQEFKNVFGEQEFERIIIENNLIDWDSVIKWIDDMDGRGCLATYDGDELELENGLYAYRIN